MPRKKLISEVRRSFERRGYTLLSTKYVNNKEKLDYVCPHGHRGSISYHNFQHGKGCTVCGIEKRARSTRLRYDDVKKAFESEGYILLSTDYLNNKQKLEFICPNGHKGLIDYHHFSSGRRCSVCAGTRRHEYEEVRRVFEEYGYTLLSTEYVNNKQKLDYMCPNGHKGSMDFAHFSMGARCPVCMGVAKPSYEEVKSYFEKEGYTLLSKIYVNAHTRMECICPEGHKYEVAYANFKQGQRCLVCSGRYTRSYEQVKKAFMEYGYTLISTEYVNSSQLLEYVCPNGHKGAIRYNNFQQGQRCPVCAGNKRLDYSVVKQVFEDEGYTLLSTEYVNNGQKLDYICPNGHVGAISYGSFQRGSRCSSCSTSVSKAELELRSYVVSLLDHSVVEANTRSVIPPLELDIFIPAKKLAIEYCGLYWHSEVGGGKPRDYHRTKMDACTEKGIRLITVFEDEYKDRPEVVKSRIANALGCIKNRVYARKCYVRIIDIATSSAFLDKYHLQGSSSRTEGWGLFYDGVLLQVLTIGRLSRAHASVVDGKRAVVYELKRFASLPGVVVVGGASRLFKAAVSFVKNKGGEYIKSYSDNRYANISNSVYEKLGFELVGESKYTPHYVLGHKRYRNQALRKTKEERLTGKTEWQLRREQGYDRIWDCGHATYIYKVE